jgi:hypothetical protein
MHMSDIELFRNGQLATISGEAVATMDRCRPAIEMWGRSHSDLSWQLLVVGAEHSPIRRLRQVAAELQRKEAAMREAAFGLRKKLVEIKIKRRDATLESDRLRAELLELEAEELEAQISALERPYRGACEDVRQLGLLHDALLQGMGGRMPTAEDFEKEEAGYWVRRAFAQSLRDVRECGRICKGEQELLEQLGFDPDSVQRMMVEFLHEQQASSRVDGTALDEFLARCTDKFTPVVVDKLRRSGPVSS